MREEIQIGLEFNLPIFVIREFNDSWLFHEIKGVKEREHIDDIQFMNEIVLKYPQEQGGTSINPSLLRKCSDIFPELPLQFKN